MSVATRAGPWSPLRHRVFRWLWAAQLASNIGNWMQTVGAQWLMGDLGGSPLLVALIQTASSLPVFLLAVPSGALGDIVDRRRLLLVAQGFTALAAGLLAVLTFVGLINPSALLGLIFLLGLGQALSQPSWQAIQPELVDRSEIPQAAAINSVSANIARAVGPAIGGLLIAAIGYGAVFAVNALSFVAILWVLLGWRRPHSKRLLPAEHVGAAISTGWRYVAHTPALRTVLLRGLMFIVFGSALWALVPIVARDSLGLGASGYGLLLGCIGVGAIVAAFVLPALRKRLALNTLVSLASVIYAGGLLVLGLVHSIPVVAVALVLTGVAWTTTVSSLNSAAQMLLPNWIRARGLAYYSVVFMGGQALGAVISGALTDTAGLAIAMTVAAAGLLATAAFGRILPLQPVDVDLDPAPFSEPNLVLDPDPEDGPVLVTIDYRVPAQNTDRFREMMAPVEGVRRRTGASRWALFQSGEDPTHFFELFRVPTWEEHLRQTGERVTVHDRELVGAVDELLAEGTEPRVSHALAESHAHGRPST
jgi:MFS family permease